MNRERRCLVVGSCAAGVAGIACARDTGNDMLGHDLRDDGIAGAAHGDPAKALGAWRLDGEIRIDDGARDAAAQDFGHLVHRRPSLVVRAASARDVSSVLRWASARGRTVAVRGCGHSVYGRSQVHDGIVIDMSGLNAIHDLQPDHAVVGAGATWSALLAATLPHGRSPVLTDYLELSVGGMLAVGGIGGHVARKGSQADNVLALDVVTGCGRRLHCTPTEQVELFDAVPAGLSQLAVITRATVRLVEVPPRVRRYQLVYGDLAAMLTDQRRMLADGRFDMVQGAASSRPDRGGWLFKLDAAKGFGAQPPDDATLLSGLSDQRAQAAITTLSYSDHAHRLAPLERALRANGLWETPHPWLTTFVGDSAIERVVQAELAVLRPEDLGAFGQVSVSAFVRHAIAAPMLRLPADDVCYAFNLIRVPAPGNTSATARLVADNRRCYERVRAHGGTLYPVSALAMSRDDWRQHFGADAYVTLAEAKERFDPAGVLTPGYAVFGDADPTN